MLWHVLAYVYAPAMTVGHCTCLKDASLLVNAISSTTHAHTASSIYMPVHEKTEGLLT